MKKQRTPCLIRPKITYDFNDSFSILLGSNIFVGDEKGRFGIMATIQWYM